MHGEAAVTASQNAMRLTLNRTVMLGIVAVIALISIGVAVNLRNIRALRQNAEMVAHTHEVEHVSTEVRRTVSEAVIYQRRFLLSGNFEFRERYEAEADTVSGIIEQLRALTSDNPVQQAHVDRIDEAATGLLQELDSQTGMDRNDISVVGARIAADEVQQRLDEIRREVADMSVIERGLLSDRERQVRLDYWIAVVGAVATLLLSLAVFFGVGEMIRRNLAAQLADQAQRFAEQERLAVTLASIGDAVVATDRHGSIIHLNRAGEALTGWNTDEVIGRSMMEVLALVHGPTGEPLEHPVARVLRSGEVVGLDRDTLLRLRDGSFRPVADSAAPIRDAAGQLTGAVMVLRDVTIERREQDAVLRWSTQQQQLASLAMQFGAAHRLEVILQLAATGACQLTGGLEAEAVSVVGGDWSRAMRSTSVAANGASRWLPAEGDARHPLRVRVIQDNAACRLSADEWCAVCGGERSPTSPPGGCVAVPLVDGLGHNVGLLQLCGKEVGEFDETDATMLVQVAQMASSALERVRLMETIQEANRRKDHFLAMLAHELRNPLTALAGGAQLIAIDPADAAQVAETAAILQQQCNLLKRLVDDLLDMSRVSQGKLQVEMRPVVLQQVLRSAVDSARPLLAAKGHSLTTQFQNDNVAMRGDSVRLSQVVINLLVNAAKYTPAGGRIELRLLTRPHEALIEVQDNGTGIAADQLDRIFGLFMQIGETRQSSQGGLGIGLTLARTLVEAHGGTIAAFSDGPGRGSLFRVCLPLEVAPGAGASTAAMADSRSTGELPAHRILLVDDDRTSLHILRQLLKSLNQEVTTASDGQTALRLINESPPDLIISDVSMPAMSGLELAASLRMVERIQRPVLVALTGHGQDADRAATAQAGFDRHLTKPVSLEQLQDLLGALPSLRDSC
jgi:PAS domain S-box-containing protein